MDNYFDFEKPIEKIDHKLKLLEQNETNDAEEIKEFYEQFIDQLPH